MSLSGLKDVDREILKYIDDSELLKVCSVNKWFYNIVCDDNFLKRRLMKYPNIEKSRQGENWKQFFSCFLYYNSEMKKKFDFSYTSGHFKKQYALLQYRLKEEKKRKYFLRAIKHFSLVKHFIEKGYLQMDDALEYACVRGKIETVKWLIDQGVNLQIKGPVCLRLAGLNERLEIIDYLITRGLSLNDDLLKDAAIYDNLKTAKYLIEKGANIHANDDIALRMAVDYASIEMVELLLRAGANGQTGKNYALKIAIKRRWRKIVSSGADICAGQIIV